MKRLLGILLGLLLSGQVYADISVSFGDSYDGFDDTANTTNDPVDATGASHVVAFACIDATAATITFSDSVSSTGWTYFDQRSQSTDITCRMGYANLASAGANYTVTANYSASGTFRNHLFWLIDSDSGEIVLVDDVSNNGSGSSVSAGTLSNGDGASVVSVLGVGISGASTGNTEGSGWTEGVDGNENFGFWNIAAHRGPETTSSIAATYTLANTVPWVAFAATFAEDEGSSEPDPPEIESVTPSMFADEDTGIVVAGSNFGAMEGELYLCPANELVECELQDVTAWADEEITFTAVQGGLSAGVTVYTFVVTDDMLANEDGYPVEFEEEAEPIVATKLIFGSQPGNVIVGQTFGAFTVRAVDDEDALDEEFDGNVTVALQTGNGALDGTLTEAAVAGIATFDDVHIDTLNTGAVIRATASGLTAADSDPFNVTAGGGAAAGFPSSSRLGGVIQ